VRRSEVEVADRSDRARGRHLERVGAAAGVLAYVLAGLTLAGFLGRWSWPFDLVANLRIQLALAAVVGISLATVSRRWWPLAISTFAALVNAALVVPFLVPSGAAPPEAAGDVLELTFLNVKVRAADVDEVARYLRGRDDDLVILAATTERWGEALEEADLGLTTIMSDAFESGLELTVLARDPQLTVEAHRLTDSRSAYVEVVAELDGQPVRILGTHPVSPLTPGRAARHDAHLRWMAGEIAAMTEPVVLLGDLNLTPWSHRYRLLLDDARLLDSQDVHGLQPSWPAALGPLGIPIDHALHSPELTVLDRQLGPSFGSDHRSVHVRVARRGEEG
jgi:endonuclease/exonuclease/phosphatase (EEP) superfamily protein YafD